MARKLLFLVALVLTSPGTCALAQVGASALKPFSLSAYGAASGAERELGYGKALGFSGGLILEHSRWIALDGRGVVLRERVPIHTYLLEAGPRVSYPYGRLRPYGEVMAGLGRSGYGAQPLPLSQAYGFAYTLDAGLDFRITHRFDWRVCDFTYNHIGAGSGVTPKIASMGVVYHIF